MVTRQPLDPLALTIALRDRLSLRAPSAAATPDDALRTIERALAEAKQPGYDAARRALHARGPRSPGEAVSAQLLPPIAGAVAPGATALGTTLLVSREGDRLQGPLSVENRLGRPLRISVRLHGAREFGALVRLKPDQTLAPETRQQFVVELDANADLAGASFGIELCDGETVLARLLVSEAAAGAGAVARVVLVERDAMLLGALRGLQELLLEHPRAARGLVGALVAEGRRFAATAEAEGWLARLETSRWLHEARLVFQVTSLSLLEHLEEPEVFPSAYLDAFCMAASSGNPDVLLDRLFGGEGRDDDV